MDTPGVSRRSFLAAIAAALAIKPEHLVRPALPNFADVIASGRVTNSIIEGWADTWLQDWHIWDTAIVQPGRETREVLFDGLSPTNFAIRGLGWEAPPETSLAELQRILDVMECQLVIGGRVYFAGSLRAIAANTFSVAAWQPITPQIVIASQSDFRLEIAGDAIDLVEARGLRFSLHGVLALS